jgi:hypothetical protein
MMMMMIYGSARRAWQFNGSAFFSHNRVFWYLDLDKGKTNLLAPNELGYAKEATSLKGESRDQI